MIALSRQRLGDFFGVVLEFAAQLFGLLQGAAIFVFFGKRAQSGLRFLPADAFDPQFLGDAVLSVLSGTGVNPCFRKALVGHQIVEA